MMRFMALFGVSALWFRGKWDPFIFVSVDWSRFEELLVLLLLLWGPFVGVIVVRLFATNQTRAKNGYYRDNRHLCFHL